MTAATIKLIEAVERLNMTGEIGDGMVANLHELAGLARLEITPHIPSIEYARARSVEAKDRAAGLERLTQAGEKLRTARNAMDSSTFHGRSRIDAALNEVNLAQAAYNSLP